MCRARNVASFRWAVQGGLDVIRKEAGLFCRTSSSVRLWWELEEPKGPKGIRDLQNLIASSAYDEYLVGPSIRPDVVLQPDPLGPVGSSSSHHRRTPDIVL